MKYSALPLRLDEQLLGSDPADWLFVLTNEGGPYLAVAREGDEYLVRVHGVADFEVNATEVVARVAGTEDEVRSTFELDVRPVLHQLDGHPALHASAVSNAFGAIAFAGPSCAGKSTIAALLSKQPGYRLVADDCLPIEVRNGAVVVDPTASCVRLRSSSAESLGETHTIQFAKYLAPREPELSVRPLRAIYALAMADTVSITPMSQREAMAFVAGHLQRLDPSDPELLRKEFEHIGAVTSGVRVATLAYPRNFDGETLARAVEQDLLTEPSR